MSSTNAAWLMAEASMPAAFNLANTFVAQDATDLLVQLVDDCRRRARGANSPFQSTTRPVSRWRVSANRLVQRRPLGARDATTLTFPASTSAAPEDGDDSEQDIAGHDTVADATPPRQNVQKLDAASMANHSPAR
jgi:hypothetical protein